MSSRIINRRMIADVRFTIGDKDLYRIVKEKSKTIIYKNWKKYILKKAI